MTHDVVALLEHAPTMRGLTRALVQAGPDLRVRSIAEGAVIQLRDGSGRLVAAVQAAQKLASPSEADRLLAHGIGDALPAQPYWVEALAAETGPGEADTAGMVRRFADSLVSQFGGVVWQPPSSLRRDDPLLVGATDHPAVTLTTDRVALAVQDRPVVPMSTWLGDAITTHTREGRGFQLVTPSSSRLTHVLRSSLAHSMTRWVVRTSDGAYHDGFSGLPLTWHEEWGFVRDPSADTAGHVPRDEASGTHLLVDLALLHPAEENLLLGGAAELLSQTLAGAVPALWGTSEPTPLSWDTAGLTAVARRRAPNASWFVLNGPPPQMCGNPFTGTSFTGTLRVTRVPDGVREHVTLAIGHPPSAEPDLTVLPGLVEELAARGDLQTISVRRRSGRPDLTYESGSTDAAIQVGLGIGAEAVASVGIDHALSAPVEGVPFGPPLTPAVWYPIGDGTAPEDRRRSRELMEHLRPGAPAQGAHTREVG
ncbi:DUF6177 family protein [Nocardiopsis synnemataformans]|uniref:DUF6177 family protein n=1 Tax=Nocardiopsis synnemataformans TaxID=61305 RepID=UPI003EBD237D